MPRYSLPSCHCGQECDAVAVPQAVKLQRHRPRAANTPPQGDVEPPQFVHIAGLGLLRREDCPHLHKSQAPTPTPKLAALSVLRPAGNYWNFQPSVQDQAGAQRVCTRGAQQCVHDLYFYCGSPRLLVIRLCKGARQSGRRLRAVSQPCQRHPPDVHRHVNFTRPHKHAWSRHPPYNLRPALGATPGI